MLGVSAGYPEMRRVTRNVVLILTCDPARLHYSWRSEYAPEMIAVEARRYPAIEAILEGVGGPADVEQVKIPLHCTDGFSEAYYGRPERFLEPSARRANSAWSFVEPGIEGRFVERLGWDIEEKTWDAKYGFLRSEPMFDGSLRLIIGHP
jgi:hypothetical protein